MAEWGALAQAAPAAAATVDAYPVPAGTRATVEVVMCNRAAASDAVRLSHGVGGAALANAQYLLFDLGIAANATTVTARFTMNAGDVLRVRSLNGTTTFNVNGIEE